MRSIDTRWNFGLTVDQMPYWQETRNEAICALLARCPMLAGVDGSTRRFLMDARGEGVPIIIVRSERISGKKAEYRDIQGSGVMLTIPGFSDDLLTNSSENSVDSSENATASSEKMTVGEQILTMIAADSSITQVAIAKKLHCPRSTVAYWFKKFADEGKIVREGPDKGGLWLVKE